MKRGGVLLLCAALVTITGCATDDIAWLKHRSALVVIDYRRALREHAAQRRTTDRLLAASRDCLDAGGRDAGCRRD